MAYITTTDLNNRFGEENVVAWSQLDPDSVTADTTRITQAIAYAESYVEGRFRGGRYLVPFIALSGSTPQELLDWMADLAGCWLYESRSGRASPSEEIVTRMESTRAAVDADINKYLCGMRQLNCSDCRSPMPNVPVGL